MKASDLHLRYQTSSETSYTDLDLKGNVLTYTYFSDDENRCAQWFKNSPCWTEADLKSRTITLSDQEMAALLALVKASGCFELEGNSFGEPNLRTRSYTETLSVKLGDQERKLRYRSSLEAEAKPGAFAQLEQALREQIKQQTQ
ncbi:MAG: hypothetical protein ACPGSM_04020 [Thiolinea sp.]